MLSLGAEGSGGDQTIRAKLRFEQFDFLRAPSSSHRALAVTCTLLPPMRSLHASVAGQDGDLDDGG